MHTNAIATDMPVTCPHPHARYLWDRSRRQADALATLASRYGTETLQDAAATAIGTSAELRARFTALDADAQARWAGSVRFGTDQLRQLLTQLHHHAGHGASTPTHWRDPAVGHRTTSVAG